MVVSQSQDNFTVLPLTPIANQTIRGSSQKTQVYFHILPLNRNVPNGCFVFEVQQLLLKECFCCKYLLMLVVLFSQRAQQLDFYQQI